ncbi:MAG TPA: hypothetical protein VEY67_08545, partial [Candidatus Dormibacteraeota bacterium]|nr:hypothetical protein [Candidatus Dormibacteraeota bacterium]
VDEDADETIEVERAADLEAAEAGTALEPQPSRTGRGPRRQERGRARGTGPAAPPSASEQVVHIDDRISAVYVIVAIAVFVGIMLYGMLLGTGGFLTATPAPSPSPSPTLEASPNASASSSAAASESASASASASPAASESASPAASGSPSPSPS